MIAIFFEKEVNNLVKGEEERHPTKKRHNIYGSNTFNFYATKEPFKKDDMQQLHFFVDLGLSIVKNTYLCSLLKVFN
jgi:hypothetical protein